MVRRAQRNTWAAGAMILCCLACCGCDDQTPRDFAPDALPPTPGARKPGKRDLVPSVQRYCWLIAIDPDREEEFRELHKKIPRPVKEAIHQFGIRDYSVCICGTNDGFYAIRYYEYVGDEHEGDMAALGRDPDFKDWRNACEECEVPLLSPVPGKWWSPAKEIVHLD